GERGGGVADGAQDQAVLEAAAAHQRAPAAVGVRHPRAAVRDDLDADQETEPSHLAHDRGILQEPEPIEETATHALRVLDEVFLLQDLDRLESSRAAAGMRIVGEALPERELLGPRGEDVVDVAADGDA